MTELEQYQLRVNKFTHNTFVDAYKLITERTVKEFPDLTDNEKYLIVQRISNRIFIQFNKIVFENIVPEVLKNGDL